MAYFDGRVEGITATPGEGDRPAVWLLGSSGYSAQVAGFLGLPFAFARHFSPRNTLPALELYRSRFEPSETLERPYAMVCNSIVCADTDEAAERIVSSSRLAIRNLHRGRPGRVPSPEDALAHVYTAAERAAVNEHMAGYIVGDPETVRAGHRGPPGHDVRGRADDLDRRLSPRRSAALVRARRHALRRAGATGSGRRRPWRARSRRGQVAPGLPRGILAAMSRFRAIFPGVQKPLIAMAHVPPLPGTPLYDASAGVAGLVSAVKRDLEHLLAAGFDAVMFCNEGDRPYQLQTDHTTSATMARVVAECRPMLDRPFGVDVLWDARCALSLACASDAAFMREVVTGTYESDMGLWQPDAAWVLRERRRLDRNDLAIFMNITPEFASPIGGRTPSQSARSTVVSSLADAILVSGPMAGSEPDVATVAHVRGAVPAEVPVLLNTGAKAATIARYLGHCDGCIVGSDLKVGGGTWNPVDPERARRFVDAARSA